jgi:glycosyltransferase involved in cell wall biosynthesis
MKILFLYDFPLWGSGSATYLRYLITELLKLNYKIGVVVPEERRFLEEKIKQYKVNLAQTPVFISHPELKGAKKYSELSDREITEIYKSYLDTTLEAVANFEPDIIHVNHLSIISWIARYIYALKKVKYIITSHGSCLYNIISDKRIFPLCEDSLRKAKAVTTVSGDTRMKLIKTFKSIYAPDQRKNIYVIPGGVNPVNFPEKVDTSYLDEKYNIGGKKIILFAGRLISQKGAKYLVNAAKNIKGEIFIVGDGPEKEHLKYLISQKKIQNVHLIDYLASKELIDFYYRSDVFVAPSVWDEPLGLTILEAMAARCPVIATRKGGIPLLIKSGYNGLFVKSRNSSQIAKVCNNLLEDDDLRKKMGENARKTVLEKFTWQKTALKFNRLYKKICNFANGNKSGAQKR